jgi:hypothetical protein
MHILGSSFHIFGGWSRAQKSAMGTGSPNSDAGELQTVPCEMLNEEPLRRRQSSHLQYNILLP